MLTGRYKFLLILVMPLLVAVNTRAVLNNYQGEINYDPGPPVPAGEPVDMSTGNNMVHEEGLRLAAPGAPLSFDLNYNSGNKKSWMIGKGWDLTLNWQLSLVYKSYYNIPSQNQSYEFGAALEKNEADGTLSEAAPGVFFFPALGLAPSLNEKLLNWLLCTANSFLGPALATADEPLPAVEPKIMSIKKYYLLSDGARLYRVQGGWTNSPATNVSDWAWNGGHYNEMPEDWELVHTNSEYKLLLPGKKWMTFGDDGRVASMGDAWGNTITRAQNGNVETYTHSNGRWLEFDWASGHVSEIKTDDGRGMRFGYSNDCLASVEWYGNGKSRTHYYHYDSRQRLAERVNAEGTVSRYGYDEQGRSISLLVGTNWYRQTVSYAVTPAMTFYGHGTSWTEDYRFDSQGRLAGIIGPWNEGAPQWQQGVTYAYDKWRNIIEEKYFEGTNESRITSVYDDHHRILSSAICRGTNARQIFAAAWSEEDRMPASVVNADGLTLNYEYTNGVVCAARLVGGGQTEETGMSGWNDEGLPEVARDARGADTHLAYNADGNVTLITLPVGPGYGFEYDSAGLVQKVNRLAPGNVTNTLAQYERDGFGKITKATYADGSYDFYTYDAMRRLKKSVIRNNQATEIEYWPIGKVKSVARTHHGGLETLASVQFDYDEQGTDLKITDELGRVVEGYALDVNGRPVTVTNILGQTMQISYAIFDLPQTINRFDGSSVNYAYDVAWRPASIQYPDDTVSLTWSAGGLLQTITDGSGTISNSYDMFSRWAGQTCPAPGGGGPYELTIVNGTGGLPVSATSIGGTVSYGYDRGSRATNIAAQPGGTFSLDYNPSNGLVAGVSCSALNASYAFDTLDRISEISWQDTSSNVVRSFAYTYNAAGMITQKVTSANSLQSSNLYSYDDLDRLVSESAISSQSSVVNLFSYDLAGNRTQMVQNGQTIRYTLSAGNRLTNWGVGGTNSRMQYAAAGNVTSIYYNASNQVSLKWDSRYRITEVRTNGIVAERYTYDALGRRISISDSSTTNYLIYNGPHVIAEVGTSGSLVRSYAYGRGIDNILSMTVYGATTQTYYYVKDHLGSVQALTDPSGTIVESYQYDAWGNVLDVKDGSGVSHPSSVVGNRFTWQGREISWATRLYYFRARWYEPVTGRWLSNDLIGISGGLNYYIFCGDDPVMFVDPNGLWYIDINVSGGFWGGLTGGILINSSGIYPYFGGGVVTPGIGASVTWSPSQISQGWNAGLQGQAYGAGQVGYGFGNNGGWFWEIGGGFPPGASLTGYYVFNPIGQNNSSDSNSGTGPGGGGPISGDGGSGGSVDIGNRPSSGPGGGGSGGGRVHGGGPGYHPDFPVHPPRPPRPKPGPRPRPSLPIPGPNDANDQDDTGKPF